MTKVTAPNYGTTVKRLKARNTEEFTKSKAEITEAVTWMKGGTMEKVMRLKPGITVEVMRLKAGTTVEVAAVVDVGEEVLFYRSYSERSF